MSATKSRYEYDHDAIETATLNGVDNTTAALIAGELGLTTIETIEAEENGQYRVELEVDGGFTAFADGKTKFGIKSVLGQGDPETITLHIVEKRI